jgi:hypothetical protein
MVELEVNLIQRKRGIDTNYKLLERGQRKEKVSPMKGGSLGITAVDRSLGDRKYSLP